MKKIVVGAVTVALTAGVVMYSADDAGGSKPSVPLSAPVGEQATLSPKPAVKPLPKPTVKRHVNTSREGVRKPVATAPKSTPKKVAPKAPSGVTISNYAWCPNSAQSCIDAGSLTGYHGNVLAGHNYRGYQWLSRVATGTTIHVTSGPLAGNYRVYGQLRLNHQGGAFPNFGGASLVLQSCEGSGTGFSLARRI